MSEQHKQTRLKQLRHERRNFEMAVHSARDARDRQHLLDRVAECDRDIELLVNDKLVLGNR